MSQYRLIKALHSEAVDCTPVWMMRQAGRYLPEYRAVREKISDFLELCKTPELACELTLQPIRRFPLDAAIIFSDILVVPEALGLELKFLKGEGPRFNNPIRNEADIKRLKNLEVEQDLEYVFKAIRLVKHELNNTLPLIGFSGSPWTLASYMIEGGGSSHFTEVRRFLYQAPEALHDLLGRLTQAVIEYFKSQIKAGVDVIMIFDTWGNLLSPALYQPFSLSYMTKIVEAVRAFSKTVPVILFTRNSSAYLPLLNHSKATAIGVDWTVDLKQAREILDPSIALQGNLDPAVLYGDPVYIRTAVQRLLSDYGPKPGHIFNLGHGIYPDIDPENVSVMIDAVKSSGRR